MAFVIEIRNRLTTPIEKVSLNHREFPDIVRPDVVPGKDGSINVFCPKVEDAFLFSAAHWTIETAGRSASPQEIQVFVEGRDGRIYQRTPTDISPYKRIAKIVIPVAEPNMNWHLSQV
jgi:hypothetical protein